MDYLDSLDLFQEHQDLQELEKLSCLRSREDLRSQLYWVISGFENYLPFWVGRRSRGGGLGGRVYSSGGGV